MTEQTRDIHDLLTPGVIEAPPRTMTDEEMRTCADNAAPLTLVGMDHKETEEFGGIWQYVVRDASGTLWDFELWDNVKRDAFSTALMQLLQGGPVTGLVLYNGSDGKKPFYYLTVS